MSSSEKLLPGDLVEYAPSMGGPYFPAVVDSEPWMLGEHTEVVRLRDLSDQYRVYVGLPNKRTVAAAATSHVRRRAA